MTKRGTNFSNEKNPSFNDKLCARIVENIDCIAKKLGWIGHQLKFLAEIATTDQCVKMEATNT